MTCADGRRAHICAHLHGGFTVAADVCTSVRTTGAFVRTAPLRGPRDIIISTRHRRGTAPRARRRPTHGTAQRPGRPGQPAQRGLHRRRRHRSRRGQGRRGDAVLRRDRRARRGHPEGSRDGRPGCSPGAEHRLRRAPPGPPRPLPCALTSRCPSRSLPPGPPRPSPGQPYPSGPRRSARSRRAVRAPRR
ncbi:Putative LuxR-family transcriptional regulator [Brachybacterium nesterenkovii]|uniref:Putative LuxR-family transcriptional regulator n=1 Tax=Brachybacterium nesterenkovii TaxID=47847 RepID=A0A1X6WWF0_9MICO|nr:Putative LuxR-family transcriptional regulator [Brachybacterium nesterenkovii]